MNRDIEQFNNYTKKCFKEDPPPCRCLCPFRLDIRSFTGKIARGNFDSAYREYRNAVVFPEIVSRICPAPCGPVCVRVKNGEAAVSIPGLEKACLEYSSDRKNIRYDLPQKKNSIAVIGAGPGGLACALKLASRNFPVTVFFREAEWGGSLSGSAAASVYHEEIEAAFSGLAVDFRQGVTIKDIGPLFEEGFSAVYIATGRDGESFGAADDVDMNSLGSGTPGVFIGGEVLGVSAAEAIEHGARASRSIEKFLQTGAMDGIPETYENWPVNERYYRSIPESPYAGTEDKECAVIEAKRCADCECSACIDVCPMLKSTKRTPKKIAADVTTTINKVEQQTRRIANRLINACNLCGLCAEVCPADVAMGECMQEARKALFKQGGMPPVFHDYYLRDLDHALSDESYFEHGAGKYMFFPGCQTGASCPDYVIKPYGAMLEKEPETAILVTCCGAPAEWAGDEGRSDELIEKIKSVWEAAGRPVLVCSCMTCRNRLMEKLPDIPVITYFEWMDHAGVSENGTPGHEALYVFDPCAARYADGACGAVRNLLSKGGQDHTSGEMSGVLAECCGYGGHIYASNPGLYDEIVTARISESELPYLVYCSNCRDAFAAQGKRCMHIFDVLFVTDESGRAAPGIGERHQNRRVVKRKLESMCHGRNDSEENEAESPGLDIPEDIALKMERELLSVSDVMGIITGAESTNIKLYDEESGHYIAHGGVGVCTCWVVYDEKQVINIYTHRMRAAEEV